MLIKKVNELYNNEQPDEAEKLLENFIEENPNNIEIILRLAVFELNAPYHDHDRAILVLTKALKLDKYNVTALLLLSGIKHFMLGGVDQETFVMLSNVKTKNLEELSMIEYVKSWFFDNLEDYIMYEKTLLKSIDIYSKHVYNNLDLGRFYLKKGNLLEAKKFILNALKNIELVYPNTPYECDFTDYQEYFYEFIKGTHTTSFMRDSIIKSLEELEPKLTIET